ncbi:hypothetical protein OP10G_4414 [Fimbriimonas ginsengisoli Gsoil 348]|uniref:Uncharacterized protein n=1 Tax=Fimbriimonas ginsengisoli Gsoil 348 TaxID=661478 RepID=A0A068NWN6_FIMGI|nr:hypothetical protein OP10G_4414 [Fimbriimonas ginsengisoli Gsoil 348]
MLMSFFGIPFFWWIFANGNQQSRRAMDRKSAQTVRIGRRAHNLRP